ncbi:hypothetical protein [Conexibacter sp. CPCC 206217]|uniref:hypothetical protein n=1 Tax=Conexibacter sp. CPCC 206217 TaxID=3064574 RepID=UPI0027261C4E|nr:hypothetical protein [Conexibacter sp. CPCC 206217]MDO8213191.1 hypothetical protein [Conexibacter sp. CPCC 206217]
MPTRTPIACSLSATELPKRLAEMEAIGADALLTADRTPTTARLRFRASDDTRERLAAIVTAESRCCAFLNFDLRDDAGAIVLTIASPADDAARLMLDELADAFAATKA